MQLVDMSYHSTLCSTCEKVCHHKCGLNEISTAGQSTSAVQLILPQQAKRAALVADIVCYASGSSEFGKCACFNSGSSCVQCGCGVSTHYHARKIYEEVSQTQPPCT